MKAVNIGDLKANLSAHLKLVRWSAGRRLTTVVGGAGLVRGRSTRPRFSHSDKKLRDAALLSGFHAPQI